MTNIGVVLFNLGGPDSLEAIEPFLYNLFSDPDIFNIPIGQKLFAKIISNRRAPKVQEEYKLIGGKSPINEWTELQRDMLERMLNENTDYKFTVITAMRYWKPLIRDIAKEKIFEDFDKIIMLPLYPHYSITTTGSSFNEWNRYYEGDNSKLIFINNYPENTLYIKALNQRIDETLKKFPEQIRDNVQLVFSAHGTPVSLVKKGDPYNEHIKQTVKAVMNQRNYSHDHHLCYQSKVGPVKWLEPATDTMIEKLSNEGKKHLLIIPISFVSDHVETLFELDIEYRHVADECGIENYIVMEGLNDSPLFIDALKEETIKAIKNKK
ncbi:MAG: ferrochelatase [Melioribacteraceae bacterium]|nr:ferrochelatase [Melioribacteraceae bacterium]